MSTMLKTLSELVRGEKRVFVALAGGREFQNRIASLGIYAGCEVEVVGGGAGGAMMIAVSGSRIALGCGMASKIIIA